MAGLDKILISLAAITIFVICFLNFAVDFGVEQGSPININNDSAISSARSDYNSQTANFEVQGNETMDVLQKSSIDETSQSGSFTNINMFISSYSNLKNVMKTSFGLIKTSIFGGDTRFSFAFGIFATVLGLLIVFAGYKLLKGGNPDD